MEARRQLTYSNVMSTVAVFLALAGGSYAIASVGKNDVGSSEVKNESLKSKDLKDDKAVESSDVVDNEIMGADVDESTLSNIGFDSLSQFPHGKATAGGPQTFADGIVTTVAFDNANPLSDIDFDETAESLTATVDGVYAITGEIHWTPNATGRRTLQLRRDGNVIAEDNLDAVATARSSHGATTLLGLNPGDVLTMGAQQTSGGDLDTVSAGSNFAALSAHLVSR